jgi:hypothetical protein
LEVEEQVLIQELELQDQGVVDPLFNSVVKILLPQEAGVEQVILPM